MFLDSSQEWPTEITLKDDVLKLLRKYGKSHEEAITDYLTCIMRHIKQDLVKRFGTRMIETTTIDFVLTVPAIWTDAAKDATLRVAEKAGMGTNLYMISEPEAAAIYALRTMGEQQKLLRSGDNFIVCDAGGGTVDLISYEIQTLTPLRLQESATGTGALCGGVFLNMRFRNLVESRMGKEAFGSFCEKKPKCWAVALRYFEDYVKRNFDPMNSQTQYDGNKFNVPLPGVEDDANMGVDCGFFILSTAEVSEIFRPIIDRIIGLIEKQRMVLVGNGKTAKGVILVGGFGQSNYLYKCVKQRFADEDPPPTYTPYAEDRQPESEGPRFVIMQPENAWTAVVRGAVLSNLEGRLVASRKARRHYGINASDIWDVSKHSLENKYWDKVEGEWRADNQISWHIKRDQDLPVSHATLFEFYRTWDLEEGYPDSIHTSIVVSDAENAPSEYKQTTQTRVLCKFDANIDDVPRTLFKRRSTKGNKYRELTYQIGMIVNSGNLEFDLRVDNKIYGSIKAKYE